MSMTPASSQYFEQVAAGWDNIRSGYFTEAVRLSAIRKAYLRPEMVVADVGAGTGFMAAGLAPLVRQVHVFDASAAMLAVARENLKGFNNIVYHEADGLTLSLPEESLGAVFANMYLHHCPDPLAAIKEMARLLQPGGRLVLTDLDAHPYTWMKDEMADVWLGFERSQIRAWLEEVGLVNVVVDCSGESCHAEAQNEDITRPIEKNATVSIFVAVGTRRVSGVKQAVQASYGAAAIGQASCCSSTGSQSGESSCCGSGFAMDGLISLDQVEEMTFAPGYSRAERALVPAEAAEISLGCGNPTALAALKPGEVVLDIGSGGGMDAMLAARQVGASGKVIGVDMTTAMLERARRAVHKAGLTQVEFRHGQAESLPVEDGSVDVILSNCVINLCEDKGLVFRETYRVLRPGGRLEISDMVTNGPLPDEMVADPAAWPGCVTGALPEQEYLDLVSQAGFKNIQVQRSASTGNMAGVQIYSLELSATK
jgi:arsenite methyltransferase